MTGILNLPVSSESGNALLQN